MWLLRPKIPASVCTFTFWSRHSRQWVHVGGLPALHHRFPHDLEVGVRLVVAGFRIMPRGLAVFSLWEDGLSSGFHFFGVFCCGVYTVDGLSLHTEEGERCHARLYIGSRMLTEHEPYNGSIIIPWQGSPMPKIVMTEDASLGWKQDKIELFPLYRINRQLDFHIRNIRDNNEIMAQYDKTIILCVDVVCGIT